MGRRIINSRAQANVSVEHIVAVCMEAAGNWYQPLGRAREAACRFSWYQEVS